MEVFTMASTLVKIVTGNLYWSQLIVFPKKNSLTMLESISWYCKVGVSEYWLQS